MPMWPRSGRDLAVPPEIVVVEFLGGRCFEAGDSASLRVETRHHMLDGPVFAPPASIV
jgi:hypothetical protein